MTRDEIIKEYDVNEQGFIQDPGKFEKEPLYAPYFYDAMLMGEGDVLDFGDGAVVTILEVTHEDKAEFPELGDATEIAIEETERGFVYVVTDAQKIAMIKKEHEEEMNKPETDEAIQKQESLDKAYQAGLMTKEKYDALRVTVSSNPDIKDTEQLEQVLATKIKAQEDLQVGTKVEFMTASLGESGYSQGEIIDITEGIATVAINGDKSMLEHTPLEELTVITEYSPMISATPEDIGRMDEEGGEFAFESSISEADQARKVVIQAMGYTDVQGQLRASFLLGTAQQKMWKAGVAQIKKAHEAEMKDRVKALVKWGTIPASPEAVRDVIAKVLIENGISPYPNLIEALYANPFQERALGGEVERANSTSEPR